jgi:ATP-binding cassette subfamily F protein 3
VTLLALDSVSKSFGSRLILDGLELQVNAAARLGVIGANGSGKSTLLRLLAGLEEPDGGRVVRRRGVVAAYLPQHPLGDERTPLETMRAARPDLAELERELAATAELLGAPEVAADLQLMSRVLARQERLLERFEAAGGPGFEGRARSVLAGLGFRPADLDQPTSALSGGRRKLVELAACLARDPDVLLLDEPEAHLDEVGRARIEQLVRSFSGAVVAVSHDRYLLDETVSSIATLERGHVRLWPGNYSAYTLARELELQRQQVLYTTQQKEIERLEAAIRRFKEWAHRVVNERHIK